MMKSWRRALGTALDFGRGAGCFKKAVLFHQVTGQDTFMVAVLAQAQGALTA